MARIPAAKQIEVFEHRLYAKFPCLTNAVGKAVSKLFVQSGSPTHRTAENDEIPPGPENGDQLPPDQLFNTSDAAKFEPENPNLKRPRSSVVRIHACPVYTPTDRTRRARIMTRLALPFIMALSLAWAQGAELFVYFGTHTAAPGVGFSIARFDTATGVLSKPEFLLEAAAPAFFVIHPDGRHLYASNSIKTFQGEPVGAVSVYEIDRATGKLTLINQQPSGGADANYAELDRTGRYFFTANYEGGSIAAFALRPDGGIGRRTAFFQHTGSSVNPQRQRHAYAHSIRIDPTNRFVLVGDLGLDKVMIYRFNAKDGTMQPNDPDSVTVPPGSGPRHLTFHPNGRLVYVLTEMGSTVIVYDWDARRGVLTQKEIVSTLPEGFTGVNNCAEIRVRPDGRFLYASNRGHDSIAVFAIDEKSGRLKLVEHTPSSGKSPRNFEFDPTGHWMLVSNHASDNAVVFSIDKATGKLTPAGEPVTLPTPFCERFLAISR